VSAAKKGRRDREPARELVPEKKERACVVDRNCLEDLQWWARTDARIATKTLELIAHVLRDPFQGPGKPEALKGLGPTHSRRITGEHRLVFTVFDDRVVFLQARYHY
jgi:toxin YoeB